MEQILKMLKKKKSKETKQKEPPPLKSVQLNLLMSVVGHAHFCYLSFPFPAPPTVPLKNQKVCIKSYMV